MGWIGTTPQDLITLAKQLEGRDFSFDTETTGLDAHKDHIVGFSCAWRDDHRALCSAYIALEHTEPVMASTEGKVVTYIAPSFAAHFLKPLLGQQGVTVIMHNAKYDIKMLKQMGVDVTATLHDTLIGAWYCDENQPSFGLKEQTLKVFGHQMDRYKDLVEFTNYGPEEFLAVPLKPAATYAMADTEWTLKHYERQVPLLEAEGVAHAFRYYGMRLLPILAEMELAGMRVDRAQTAVLRDAYTAKAQEYGARVWNAGMDMIDAWLEAGAEIPAGFLYTEADLAKRGEQVTDSETDDPILNGRRVVKIQPSKRHKPRLPYFNVGSVKHMTALLYDHLGLKAPTEFNIQRKEDGSYGVDKNVLKLMKYKLGDEAPEVLNDLLDWRKYEKAVGTYLEPFLVQSDQRGFIHGNFNQHITRTGRLSSSSPNLQNITARGEMGKEMRSLFIAPEGEKLVVADFSMLELRLLAHFSNDPIMRHAFENGLDLHTVTGARQAGLTYEELKARVDAEDVAAKGLRTIGKTANFALSYGMGPKKYQIYLLVNNGTYFPLREVEKQIAGYNKAYPQRYQWAEWLKARARKDGYVRTLSGRKRRLPQVYSNDRWEAGAAERQAVNVLAQGGGADILAYVMPLLQDRLRSLGGRLICQVHDELVSSVPEDRAAEACQIVAETMSVLPSEHFKLRVPLVAEAHAGDNWYSAKG